MVESRTASWSSNSKEGVSGVAPRRLSSIARKSSRSCLRCCLDEVGSSWPKSSCVSKPAKIWFSIRTYGNSKPRSAIEWKTASAASVEKRPNRLTSMNEIAVQGETVTHLASRPRLEEPSTQPRSKQHCCLSSTIEWRSAEYRYKDHDSDSPVSDWLQLIFWSTCDHPRLQRT